MKDFLVLLVGAILGVIATVLLQEPVERTVNGIRDSWRPERQLERADKLRRRMTEIDLRAAADQYEKLLGKFAADHPMKAKVYQGLSRTYGDLCTLYFRRGLFYHDFAAAAKDYAEQAERELPGQPETAIALAYSFFCSEAEARRRSQTETKVKELRKSHGDNFDVQYLSWLLRLDQDPTSFPKRLDAEQNPPLMPLLDVGHGFVMEARTEEPARRDALWKRADQYFLRAQGLFPDNPLISFNRGHLAQVSGNAASARDYYKKALEKETNFPRARNNLGVTHASNSEWNDARLQFEAAAATPNAPAQAQLFALGNLGELYWEQDDVAKACKTWEKAQLLPGSDEDSPHLVHLALCAYPKDRVGCCRYYTKAIQTGKKVGWDLTKVNTFEKDWHLGPKELGTLKMIMKDCAPRVGAKK